MFKHRQKKINIKQYTKRYTHHHSSLFALHNKRSRFRIACISLLSIDAPISPAIYSKYRGAIKPSSSIVFIMIAKATFEGRLAMKYESAIDNSKDRMMMSGAILYAKSYY